MKGKKEIAVKFGLSLDNDEFNITKSLLDPGCRYFVGDDVLSGPDDICQSYEQNMIEGRKKLDKLEWGKSRVEAISGSEFCVHFTDYLTHRGKRHTHKCRQLLMIDDHRKITTIKHIHNQDEQERLDQYYMEVGLNKK